MDHKADFLQPPPAALSQKRLSLARITRAGFSVKKKATDHKNKCEKLLEENKKKENDIKPPPKITMLAPPSEMLANKRLSIAALQHGISLSTRIADHQKMCEKLIKMKKKNKDFDINLMLLASTGAVSELKEDIELWQEIQRQLEELEEEDSGMSCDDSEEELDEFDDNISENTEDGIPGLKVPPRSRRSSRRSSNYDDIAEDPFEEEEGCLLQVPVRERRNSRRRSQNYMDIFVGSVPEGEFPEVSPGQQSPCPFKLVLSEDGLQIMAESTQEPEKPRLSSMTWPKELEMESLNTTIGVVGHRILTTNLLRVLTADPSLSLFRRLDVKHHKFFPNIKFATTSTILKFRMKSCVDFLASSDCQVVLILCYESLKEDELDFLKILYKKYMRIVLLVVPEVRVTNRNLIDKVFRLELREHLTDLSPPLEMCLQYISKMVG